MQVLGPENVSQWCLGSKDMWIQSFSVSLFLSLFCNHVLKSELVKIMMTMVMIKTAISGDEKEEDEGKGWPSTQWAISDTNYHSDTVMLCWWWSMMVAMTLLLGQEDGQDDGGLTWARSRVEWWQFSTFATLIVAFDTLPGNCGNDDNYGDEVDNQQFHQAATSSPSHVEKWVTAWWQSYTCNRRRRPRTQSQSPLSKPDHKLIFRPITK